MTVWDKQYQFFSKDKDYKLVFVDLPGYGLCEKLCDCKFESIKKMLLDNMFYSQVINQSK